MSLVVTIAAQDNAAIDAVLLKRSAWFVVKLLAGINPVPAQDTTVVALVYLGVEFGQFLAGQSDWFIFCNHFFHLRIR